MNLTTAIAMDPGSYIPIATTEAGRAYWVTGVRRYVIEFERELESSSAGSDEDQVRTRELWTSSLVIVRQLLDIDVDAPVIDMMQQPAGIGVQVSMW